MAGRCKFKYVGLIGMRNAGKDICARYLEKEFGYLVIDLGKIVAEEIRKRKFPLKNETFHAMSIELRRKEGLAVVVKRAVEEWIPWMQMNVERGLDSPVDFSSFKYVFNGIRNIEEVDFLRERYDKDLCAIGIYASPWIRFLRGQKRQRTNIDVMDYEEFLKTDREQLRIFGIGNAMIVADLMLLNEGPLEELYRNLGKIIIGA